MKTILLSRTDSIGDVVLTLPLAGFLKEQLPDSHIIFLGKNYTKAVVDCCKYVDTFISWDDFSLLNENDKILKLKSLNIDIIVHVFPNKDIAILAKKAGIGTRIGTSHRIFHWTACNKLVHFSRKKSNLHESELNLKLISPIVDSSDVSFENILNYIAFEPKTLFPELKQFIVSEKFNLIIHPKSKGSAREWGLDNYNKLISLLSPEKFNIILTGTEEEGKLFREKLVLPNKQVNDLSGKLSLEQLIYLISISDGLLACSTGPLHIAAMLNINTIGLYPPIKPMHPERWNPIGNNTKVFVKDITCNKCRKGRVCNCIIDISPENVVGYLEGIL